MKKCAIAFFISCLMTVAGLLIRLVGDNYILASIFIGLGIVGCSYGIISFAKSRNT